MRHFAEEYYSGIIFLSLLNIISIYYIYIGKLNYGAFIKILSLLILPLVLSGNFALAIFGRFTMNIFWLSVGISFAAAFLINYFYLKSRAGTLMIDSKFLNRQISYDIDTTFDDVMNLTRKITADLTRSGIADKIGNKVVFCLTIKLQ